MNTCAILSLLLASTAVLVEADLPIHSVMNSVKGHWIFSLGKITSDHPLSCGGGAPNLNIENLIEELQDYDKWMATKVGGVSRTIGLQLSDESIVLQREPAPRNRWKHLAVKSSSMSNGVVGKWTMVYDEGFEVEHANIRLLGFLKYRRLDGSDCPPELNGDDENQFGMTKCYQTDPTKTHIGWFVEENKNPDGSLQHRWGCFLGAKQNITSRHTSFAMESAAPSNLSFMTQEFVNHQNTKKMLWSATVSNPFGNSTAQELSLAVKKFYHKYQPKDEYSLPASFLQKDTHRIKPSGIFPCSDSTSLLQTPLYLPKKFSWGDPFVSESSSTTDQTIGNQGNCGSCYALSSVYVLQKRFEILLSKIFKLQDSVFSQSAPLSSQSVLSCSMYNQGCDGGYPFLVGKHAKEIGIPTTECMDYLATHDPKVASCLMNIGNVRRGSAVDAENCGMEHRWFASKYGYVGGCYECCNERKMMEEIYHHGPVVVALDSPDQLFSYEDGIFDIAPTDHGSLCDDPGKELNGWEFTNHAVVVVGWGEIEPENLGKRPTKYWIVRNTWGPAWGRNGYFKILRGKNLAGIESQAVFIDPDLSRGQGFAAAQQLRKATAVNSTGPSFQSVYPHV